MFSGPFRGASSSERKTLKFELKSNTYESAFPVWPEEKAFSSQ